MSETPCQVPGCQEVQRHEHRRSQFDIRTAITWYELRASDVPLLNEARAVHALPLLVFGQEDVEDALVFTMGGDGGGTVRPAPPEPDTPQ